MAPAASDEKTTFCWQCETAAMCRSFRIVPIPTMHISELSMIDASNSAPSKLGLTSLPKLLEFRSRLYSRWW